MHAVEGPRRVERRHLEGLIRIKPTSEDGIEKINVFLVIDSRFEGPLLLIRQFSAVKLCGEGWLAQRTGKSARQAAEERPSGG